MVKVRFKYLPLMFYLDFDAEILRQPRETAFHVVRVGKREKLWKHQPNPRI